jgi:glutathione S-transferase
MPALVLDDGTIISESIAICRYFEALRPQLPLFGTGPKEIAIVEMWNRRCELNLLFPVAHVFRHTHPAMKELEVPQVPAWAEANRPRVIDLLRILDAELAAHPFVAGEHYTVADITALCAIEFMKPARIPMPDDLVHIKRWHADVAARPSAKA